MSIEQIAENIYADTAYVGANVACINTKQGVVLVDTPTLKKDIIEWRDFVHGLNPNGIRYLINTHLHYDHIMGNNLLGGIVVMQEQAREKMFDDDENLRDFIKAMPGVPDEEVQFVLNEPLIPSEITFKEELTLSLDGCTIELRRLGGHSPCSTIVYVVEDRVLVTGDIVTADLHPYKGHACFADWMIALKKLQTYETARIVPGHGELCDKGALDRLTEYMQSLWDMTRELGKAGRSLDEIVQAVHEAMFGHFEVDPERLERAKMTFDAGTLRLYEEIMRGDAV